MPTSGRAQRSGSAGAAPQLLARLCQVKGDAGAEELGALCPVLRAAPSALLWECRVCWSSTTFLGLVRCFLQAPLSQEMQEV